MLHSEKPRFLPQAFTMLNSPYSFEQEEETKCSSPKLLPSNQIYLTISHNSILDSISEFKTQPVSWHDKPLQKVDNKKKKKRDNTWHNPIRKQTLDKLICKDLISEEIA